MNVADIKNLVMHQTNNDVEDLGEFMPYLMGYVNMGYTLLMHVWGGGYDITPLHGDTDVPALPEWTHGALADYATYCVYRNGNPQKQQRGYAFLNSFEEVRKRLLSEGGKGGKVTQFRNIPR